MAAEQRPAARHLAALSLSHAPAFLARPWQVVPNVSDFTALQAAWRGSSSSAGGPGATMSAGAGRRRSLLDSSSDAGNETELPASAVGTWTNCTATCTYTVRGPCCPGTGVAAVAAACGQWKLVAAMRAVQPLTALAPPGPLQGLSSGQYSLQVRGRDAAGNVGNASQPYPFEVRRCLWLWGELFGGACAEQASPPCMPPRPCWPSCPAKPA